MKHLLYVLLNTVHATVSSNTKLAVVLVLFLLRARIVEEAELYFHAYVGGIVSKK